MNKNKKIIILTIFFIITITIISIFLINKHSEKSKIQVVLDTYCNENVQERINTQSSITNDNFVIEDLLFQIDGKNVLGVIEIDDINYEGLIYEGTSMQTLAKGVGHFENTPYFEGNVCLAAHNTNKFWAKLHTLKEGALINYYSFLGTKQYKVFNISSVSETDWSNLENTEENTLTLITCIKGQKDNRLCVQAKEF